MPSTTPLMLLLLVAFGSCFCSLASTSSSVTSATPESTHLHVQGRRLDEGAPRITEEPIVGGVTTKEATVQFRTNVAAEVSIVFARKEKHLAKTKKSTLTKAVSTTAEHDYTGKIVLANLEKNKVYHYEMLIGGERTGVVQKFRTFPKKEKEFTFVVFADVANNDRFARSYAAALATDDPLFAAQIGDMDHSDPRTLKDIRAMHRRMRSPQLRHGRNLRDSILSQMSLVHTWDDHDYCGQDENKNCRTKAEALQAFDEYFPTHWRPNPSRGIWHSFQVGDAEVFMLDTRTQRDDGLDFDNATKSMLDGDNLDSNDQKTWLLEGLKKSKRTWKIVVSSVTANKFARLMSIDNWWQAYRTETMQIAQFIADENIQNIIMISADLHTGGGVDDGTHNGWGIPEIAVAHTNLRRGNRLNLGTWSEGVTSGFNGGEGYAAITVSPEKLTMSAKNNMGEVLHSLTLTAV